MSNYSNRYPFLPKAPFIDLRADSRMKEGWDVLSKKGYDGFEAFFLAEKERASKRDLGLLYFLRGCLKQDRCDPTLLTDFECAEALLQEPIRLAPDFMQYFTRNPRLLHYIRPNSSALFKHRVAVEKSGPVLDRLTQNPMCGMICSVVVGEIFYLNGKIPQAIASATPAYVFANENKLPLPQCYAGFLLMRCAIMTGNAEWFRQMLDSVTKVLKMTPLLRETRKRLLDWINATTGYLGMAPRYTALPNGIEILNIDARVAYRRSIDMKNKIASMHDPTAGKNQPVKLADVYTHLFHAMMFFKHCEPDEAVRHFVKADAITRENRIYMPFAEYGDQIIPLIRHAMKKGAIARPHMHKLIITAETFEKGLRAIREDAAHYEQTGMPDDLFTQAEQIILYLMCIGKNNEEIAAMLGNRPNTVSELARRVFRKMQVDNRKEAIDKATHKKYFL